MRRLNKKGFTLIELLIVIAIIGILAAVVIAVINPAKQREKAQDGVVKSTMSKVILALQSYYSAYGVYPYCGYLLTELNGATSINGCTTASDQGTFSIAGVSLPSTCADTAGYAGGTTACPFRYEHDRANGEVCIHAKAFRDRPYYFLWQIDPDGTTTYDITDTDTSCNVY